MRDPYNRVVSMFLNKIVDIDVRHLADVRREAWVPWDPDAEFDPEVRARVYKNYLTHHGQGCYNLPLDPDKSLLDFTFRDFVNDVLTQLDLSTWFDPHFAYQTRFFFTHNSELHFDDVVMLEDLPQAYEVPAKALGIELDLDPDRLKQAGRVGKKIDVDGEFHSWTVRQWWDLGASPDPKHYGSFYTESLMQKVYNLYKPDFDLIAQVK